MITLKYSQLVDLEFARTLQTLNQQVLPIKTAYQLKKICDDIMKERKLVQECYQKEILSKYAKKDPDGKVLFIVTEDGNRIPELDEATKKEFMASQQEFGEREVKIDRHKLFLESLNNIEMSVQMLSHLDPIVTEFSLVVGESQIASAQAPTAG